MLKRKLTFLVTMVIIASMVVIGCGSKDAAPSPTASKSTVVIKLGHGQNLDSAAQKSTVSFAEEVKQKTNGAVDVQVFPANQLGNERDLAEGCLLYTSDAADEEDSVDLGGRRIIKKKKKKK